MADSKVKVEAPVETAAPAAIAAGTAKGLGIIPLLIVGVALIAASAVVTFFVVKMTMPAAHSEAAGEGEGEGGKEGPAGTQIVLPVTDIFVNIAETKGTRVLKVVPNLVLSEEALKIAMDGSMPMLRDRIASAASKLTIDDLEGINGRDTLKREIISQLNTAYQARMAGAVIDVYFSEYLIQ